MLAGALVGSRQLGFEERVRAQEAIDRVYYSHQIGTTEPFERAFSRELFEQRVRLYLRQSMVLEEYWNTSITAEDLGRELERMVRGTRMPEHLRCLEPDGSDTEAHDDVTPAAGEVRYFLTRAGNACGDGPAGESSAGEPHSVRDCS